MKLLRLKLIGEYKLLKGTGDEPFLLELRHPTASTAPICLVGLNGSGKSSLIELIADTFCYADRLMNPPLRRAEDLPYQVDLEYSLDVGGVPQDVHLTCRAGEVSLHARVDGDWVPVEGPQFLPDAVFAYSSGHNQALSSVFGRNQYAFFDAVRTQGVFNRNYSTLYSRLEGRSTAHDERIAAGIRDYLRKSFERSPHFFNDPATYNPELDPDEGLETVRPALPSGIFSDRDSNQFVFIAACLIKQRQFEPLLHERLKISHLTGFDLDLRLSEYRHIDFVTETVARLTDLATNRDRFDVRMLKGTLEYTVNDQFYEHLDEVFVEGREKFLEALRFLWLLSAKRWSRDEVRALSTAGYIRNVPIPAGGYAPVRVLNTRVRLLDPDTETLYDKLSDGEHQMAQVLAALSLFGDRNTLFILDEPESHFNPLWRAEFVDIVGRALSTADGGRDMTDVLISTHSPFVVSGCRASNVFKFICDGADVSIVSPAEETYGASFDYLLAALFDMNTLIATEPVEELRTLLREGSPEALEDAKTTFGGSIEKAAIFARLDELSRARE